MRASWNPKLVCEVDFTEWTSRTGQLRHPSFKGLRWDPEFGMKDLAEALQDMAEEQRDRLPAHGTAD